MTIPLKGATITRAIDLNMRRGRAFGARVAKVVHMLRADLRPLQPRLRIMNLVVTCMPPTILASIIRSALYRLAGARIGSHTYIFGKVEFSGQGPVVANVSVGQDCGLNTPLFLNASAQITIGDRVGIGHHVVIITDDHDMTDPRRRCGERFSRPVTIEDGVWIGARVTILPGVTIGRGSVVAAGSVVCRDVAPHTLVGGVPARFVRRLLIGAEQGFTKEDNCTEVGSRAVEQVETDHQQKCLLECARRTLIARRYDRETN